MNLNDQRDPEAADDRKPQSHGFFHVKYFQIKVVDKLLYYLGKPVRFPGNKCAIRIQFVVRSAPSSLGGSGMQLVESIKNLVIQFRVEFSCKHGGSPKCKNAKIT